MDREDILVVIAYPDDSKAQAARERLSVLSMEDLIELELTAYLTKDTTGKITLHRSRGHTGIRGIFSGQSETAGIDDETLQESGQSLDPGAAALCLRVRSVAPERVIPELSKFGGAVIKTSLPPDREQLLRDAFARQLSPDEVSAELNR